MADSQKLKVMKALTVHLQAMNPDNTDPATEAPYDIDMSGDQVQRGRRFFSEGETVDQPLISILEATKFPEPITVAEKLLRKSMWLLLVQGFVKNEPVNPLDPAYDLLAKTEMRLARICKMNRQGNGEYPGEYRLDGLIDSLVIGEGIVRPSDPQVSPSAFFYLPVAVEITRDLNNPYAA